MRSSALSVFWIIILSITVTTFSNKVIAGNDCMRLSEKKSSKCSYVDSNELTRLKSIEKDYQYLQYRFNDQSEKIADSESLLKSYENQLKAEDNKINYPLWVSLLLAGAALIVTTVGIGVAILSLVGYRQILRKSASKAEKAAETKTKEIAENIVMQNLDLAVKAALDSMVERGQFDKVIQETVNAYIYRGISLDTWSEDDKSNGAEDE